MQDAEQCERQRPCKLAAVIVLRYLVHHPGTHTPVTVRRRPTPPADRPTPNAFPGCNLPVLYLSAHDGRTLRAMKWGLTPSFAKPERAADGHWKFDSFRMFNARGESVGDKPSFKRLVDRKRCVVIVDGFYEWKTDAHGEKQVGRRRKRQGR